MNIVSYSFKGHGLNKHLHKMRKLSYLLDKLKAWFLKTRFKDILSYIFRSSNFMTQFCIPPPLGSCIFLANLWFVRRKFAKAFYPVCIISK